MGIWFSSPMLGHSEKSFLPGTYPIVNVPYIFLFFFYEKYDLIRIPVFIEHTFAAMLQIARMLICEVICL